MKVHVTRGAPYVATARLCDCFWVGIAGVYDFGEREAGRTRNGNGDGG